MKHVGGLIVLPAFLVLIGGCDLSFQQRDILDAARLFEENPETFDRIREHYPGPFTEARRIPAFEQADDRPEDIAFLEELRETVPVELLSLYSFARSGGDVVEVVVGTYGLAVSGSVVSLIYFETFDRGDVIENGVEVFDACDERALAWLETAREKSYADVYCRLNDHWYAYQSVT